MPAIFWNSQPLDQLERWIHGHVPPELAPNIGRGMETARFKLSEKAALTQAADGFVESHSRKPL